MIGDQDSYQKKVGKVFSVTSLCVLNQILNRRKVEKGSFTDSQLQAFKK